MCVQGPLLHHFPAADLLDPFALNTERPLFKTEHGAGGPFTQLVA